MDLNRLQQLAGLPLTESKQPVMEETSENVEAYVQNGGRGLMGDMVNLMDGKAVKKIVEILGLTKDKPIKVGKGFMGYDGHQLVIFQAEKDWDYGAEKD